MSQVAPVSVEEEEEEKRRRKGFFWLWWTALVVLLLLFGGLTGLLTMSGSGHPESGSPRPGSSGVHVSVGRSAAIGSISVTATGATTSLSLHNAAPGISTVVVPLQVSVTDSPAGAVVLQAEHVVDQRGHADLARQLRLVVADESTGLVVYDGTLAQLGKPGWAMPAPWPASSPASTAAGCASTTKPSSSSTKPA